MPSQKDTSPNLTNEWALPHAATFGSSVRTRGILLEILARLPAPLKKSLSLKDRRLIVSLPEDAKGEFETVSAVVSKAVEGIESLPVIPREIENILGISTSERHRWLKDGRLKSAGTRTIKLRGRAKQVTFHVFDPRHVEDLLDRDLVAIWREDDAVAAAENRRWAAEKRALKRAEIKGKTTPAPTENPQDPARFALKGWAEFERNGPLR
jgi:hypothetical protein